MPIVLAEHVHRETQIPNMVNWCDIGVANPNSNVLNFFELLMGSENNKFSFFLIKLKHIIYYKNMDIMLVIPIG